VPGGDEGIARSARAACASECFSPTQTLRVLDRALRSSSPRASRVRSLVLRGCRALLFFSGEETRG
jgi:hypothetical protein